ncbi:MAG: hypothetical protein NVSMB5_11910 [Candidatus Velthaea sp.]
MNDVDPESKFRPSDPRTGAPLPPRDQPGYYPGFSTLGQQRFWDARTREVVLQRVDEPPSIRFFDPEAERFWTLVFEHLIPQTDRTPERRIPVVSVVDHRLYVNQTVGYRFADMPPDREAYALGRQAIDEEARAAHDAAFVELDFAQREAVLGRIHAGEPRAAAAIWERMSVHRFWQLIAADAVEAYYAHPWAWDEVGFGGPAYPRAYTRLERGEPEPWEVRERRYAWAAPAGALSDDVENSAAFHTESEQHRSHSKASSRT